MAEITAQAVKALRDLTDLPMMLCKQALVEAEGDQEQAIEVLKRQVGKVRAKRADNPTREGRIFTQVSDDDSEAVMVEIQCESEPVGRGQDLEQFGRLMARQLLEGPGAETPEVLLTQQAPDGSGKTLGELFDELVNKIRENIQVTRLVRAAGPVGEYVHHDGKTGVLFQAAGESDNDPILRDVAMHVASMHPTAVDVDGLDAATVKAERDQLGEEARATGKPDNIIEKIVEGRMKNWYVDQGVLVLQTFVKDDSKTVGQVLAERGLKAAGFHRWAIGV